MSEPRKSELFAAIRICLNSDEGECPWCGGDEQILCDRHKAARAELKKMEGLLAAARSYRAAFGHRLVENPNNDICNVCGLPASDPIHYKAAQEALR